MLTCLCRPIRERDLRLLVRAGAHSVEAVGRACGAGTCCGTCKPEIARIVAEETERVSDESLAAK